MSKPISGVFQAARDAEAHGRFAQAVRLFKRITRARPKNWGAWARLAVAQLDSGHPRAAVKSMKEVLRLGKTDALTYAVLGQAYLELGHYRSAARSLEESLRLESTSGRLVSLARAYDGLGETAKARATLERALGLDRANEDATFNLATLERHRNPARAEALLKRLIRSNRREARFLRELGLVKAIQGDDGMAIRLLRRAIKLSSADRWAHVYLGKVFEAAGRRKEAEKAYRSAIAVAPDATFPRLFAARFYRRTGKTQRAKSEVLEGLKLDPKDVDLSIELGYCLLAENPRAGRSWLMRLRKRVRTKADRRDVERALGTAWFRDGSSP